MELISHAAISNRHTSMLLALLDNTVIGLNHYLVLGAFIFVCGLLSMMLKRNAIGILMGVELVLNGATVNFVAFAHFNAAFEVEGQIFALFVIVLAAVFLHEKITWHQWVGGGLITMGAVVLAWA